MRKKVRLVSYKEMFLDDIKKYIEYSIVKYKFQDRRKTIVIESENDNFKEYLLYNKFTYLEYEFLEEVSTLIEKTIEKGKAEAIILKYKDDENDVKGFEIRVPEYNFRFKGIKYTYFFQKQPIMLDNKKYIVHKFKNEEIIFMNCKKLKISKYKMKRILRNLDKDDNLSEILSLSQKKFLLYGQYEKLIEKGKVNIYKDTKKIRWNGRNFEGELLTLPYVYFRKVEFYKYLINLLNITMEIINKEISKQRDILYKGRIIVKTQKIEELDEILNSFLSGNAKYSDFRF